MSGKVGRPRKPPGERRDAGLRVRLTAGELRRFRAAAADDMLRALRAEAAVVGDLEQVAICDRAIAGDEAAIRECARIIADAAAQVE